MRCRAQTAELQVARSARRSSRPQLARHQPGPYLMVYTTHPQAALDVCAFITSLMPTPRRRKKERSNAAVGTGASRAFAGCCPAAAAGWASAGPLALLRCLIIPRNSAGATGGLAWPGKTSGTRRLPAINEGSCGLQAQGRHPYPLMS